MKGRSSNRTRSSRFPATSPSSSLPSYVPFSMLVLPTPGSRAGIVVGLLLAGSAPTTSFVPSSTSSVRGLSSPSLDTQVHHRRACVRPRQRAIGTGSMRLSASGPGETGGYEGEGRAEDIDSSELYADLRRRMEELHRRDDVFFPERKLDEDGTDVPRNDRSGSTSSTSSFDTGLEEGAEARMYSGQEMKKAYYEAFWRARNLHKEANFEITEIKNTSNNGGSRVSMSGSSSSIDSTPSDAAIPSSSTEQQSQQEQEEQEQQQEEEEQIPASHVTTLTPSAMNLIMSRFAQESEPAPSAEDESAVVSSSDVQGLTQMYYLEAEEEAESLASSEATPTIASASSTTAFASSGTSIDDVSGATNTASQRNTVGDEQLVTPAALGTPQQMALEEGKEQLASAADERELAGLAQPQGLSQMFFLDLEEEEAAAATLPIVEGRSFLSEKLGVPGEVVQDLKQVELDHARLAMLAVLLSGAVTAGVGVPTSASGIMDPQAGLSALAEVARTPWLDPCVAGVILGVKALSEGDWRIGKGALAGWADQALKAVSESGAKVLRLSSGDEMRRLALDMEVKHGRLALGAVVWAMAQQGLVTCGA